MAAGSCGRTPARWRRTATATAPPPRPSIARTAASCGTLAGLRRLGGLRVALHHFVLQHAPDFAMQLVELLFHPHFRNFARACQGHLPVPAHAPAPPPPH